MRKEILINTMPQETRVAILEGGTLVELLIERRKDQGLLGNIYKGRVLKVLPGMQAAFVDIGQAKAGFLYVADVQEYSDDYDDLFFDESESVRGPSSPSEIKVRIEEMLREGQEIIVQVSKEPLGAKGARLTNRVALPGRYLVLLPGEERIGISRRITDEAERERLRLIMQSIRPQGHGFIVRTAAEGTAEEEFRRDLDFLAKLWKRIRDKADRASAPSLVHTDLDILLKTVRDQLSGDVDRLVIDDAEGYHRLAEFTATFLPHHKTRLELYRGQEPLFDAYGLEIEVGKLLDRKVWLKSGGYISIDSTEALVSIDVNTGKYVGRGSFEDTILKTNLEAAREIAYQLRLRNLGGIVIIDFIDMENPKDREKVSRALEEALIEDRATSKILQISELGLVEMTRKRNRPPLETVLSQTCPYCKGKGQIKSTPTVALEVYRELLKVGGAGQSGNLSVEAHPAVADTLLEEERQHLEALERNLGKSIVIKVNANFHHEEYVVTPLEDEAAP